MVWQEEDSSHSMGQLMIRKVYSSSKTKLLLVIHLFSPTPTLSFFLDGCCFVAMCLPMTARYTGKSVRFLFFSFLWRAALDTREDPFALIWLISFILNNVWVVFLHSGRIVIAAIKR